MISETIAQPQTLHESGIRRTLLHDLALKILYLEGELSLLDLAEKMRLSTAVIQEVFQHLRKEALCEVKGMVGHIHRIATTSQGKSRALELLSLNQYAGAAPVSLADYIACVREQSVGRADVHPPDIERAFAHMVLDPQTLRQLGTAIVSGTSIVLHGPTGTGKTTIAEALPRVYHDAVWIPYAVEVDAQIITVYDSGIHERIDRADKPDHDLRWVLCRRPRVVVGGELTIEMLELQFNPVAKFYAAPAQMKANNGVFIVDDFGRQRVPPEQLLNRWIVPLDRKIDYLTLMGGKKFEIPFDLFVVFATNLDPSTLADAAFLRRIQNKIEVGYMAREEFLQVFQKVCQSMGLAYDAAVAEYATDLLTKQLNEPLRACYPRDIVQQICWAARYAGTPPRLDNNAVAEACHNYFLRG